MTSSWPEVTLLPLSVVSFHSDRETGELLIDNHTDSNVGSYMCEAKNAVGRAQCRYALHAYERESDNGAG